MSGMGRKHVVKFGQLIEDYYCMAVRGVGVVKTCKACQMLLGLVSIKSQECSFVACCVLLAGVGGGGMVHG